MWVKKYIKICECYLKIKKMCLTSHSKRGLVSLATRFGCTSPGSRMVVKIETWIVRSYDLICRKRSGWFQDCSYLRIGTRIVQDRRDW